MAVTALGMETARLLAAAVLLAMILAGELARTANRRSAAGPATSILRLVAGLWSLWTGCSHPYAVSALGIRGLAEGEAILTRWPSDLSSGFPGNRLSG